MISEQDLVALRSAVELRVSKKRFLHVLGVEDMARRIGERCLPNKLYELSAAALLHDVAKEIPIEEQIAIISNCASKITAEELNAPQIIHSFTAPHVVLRDFPQYATEEILSAVEKHTLGDADMSIFDEIIFIADYAEAGRSYESCIEVRNYLLDNLCSRGVFSLLHQMKTYKLIRSPGS